MSCHWLHSESGGHQHHHCLHDGKWRKDDAMPKKFRVAPLSLLFLVCSAATPQLTACPDGALDSAVKVQNQCRLAESFTTKFMMLMSDECKSNIHACRSCKAATLHLEGKRLRVY